MQTKLTLRLDEELIRRAKKYSEKRGKSVSQIVADYFALLLLQTPEETDALPPLTASLKGILSGTQVDEKDYRKFLKGKHK